MYSSVDNRDEKIRNIMGKLDELDYQIKTYRAGNKGDGVYKAQSRTAPAGIDTGHHAARQNPRQD